MLKTYFIHTGKEIFKCLQENYSLSLQISKSELAYHNSCVSFSVYLDRGLDIYICFHIGNCNLYLYDLVKQLGFEDILLPVKQNHVSDIVDIERILNNLQAVMQRVLDMVKDNPALLVQCYERQKVSEAKRLKVEQSSFLLRKLDAAWKNKQYAELVYLFEANEDLVDYISKSESVKKRVNYARKFLQEKQKA